MDDTALADDLRRLIDDAQMLLQHSVEGAGHEYLQARQRFEQSLLAAKQRLAAGQDDMLERGREAASAAGRYVREHPWESIGVAAALGVALGLILGRK